MSNHRDDETHGENTSDFKQLASLNFTFSKRQIGVLLVIFGVAGVMGLLLLDTLGGGRDGGIGPSQQLGIIGMIGLLALGITLIPLGDDAI